MTSSMDCLQFDEFTEEKIPSNSQISEPLRILRKSDFFCLTKIVNTGSVYFLGQNSGNLTIGQEMAWIPGDLVLLERQASESFRQAWIFNSLCPTKRSFQAPRELKHNPWWLLFGIFADGK